MKGKKEANIFKQINDFLNGDKNIKFAQYEYFVSILIIFGPREQSLSQEIKEIFADKKIDLHYSKNCINIPAIEIYLAFNIARSGENIDDLIKDIPKKLIRTAQPEKSLLVDSSSPSDTQVKEVSSGDVPLPPPSPVKIFTQDHRDYFDSIDIDLLRSKYDQIISSRIHQNVYLNFDCDSIASKKEQPQSETYYKGSSLQEREMMLIEILKLSGEIIHDVTEEAKAISREESKPANKSSFKTLSDDSKKDLRLRSALPAEFEENSGRLDLNHDDNTVKIDEREIDERYKDQIRRMQEAMLSQQKELLGHVESALKISEVISSLEEMLSVCEKYFLILPKKLTAKKKYTRYSTT